MFLTIENVRCFSNKQRVEIRPLTILVGENSSGKSTFLSMLHASMQGEFPTIPKIFNQAPFEMGGFDTIATYKGGKYGRAETFSIGLEWNRRNSSSSHSMFVTFESNRGMPTVRELEVSMDDVSVKVTSADNKVQLHITQNLLNEEKKKLSTTFPYRGMFSDDLQFFMRRSILEIDLKDADKEFLIKAQDAVRYGFREKLKTYAMSPLRTEPKRTYDESSDLDFTPGGGHIPRVLSQLDFENDTIKNEIFDSLNEFGRSAGLFDSIKVKHHGSRPNDPFQVRVVTQGPAANLADVGYGVSQALPILVEVLKGARNEQFILQQPEVHLHPRAQAALGSFFVNAVALQKKHFVIETHSDYLIDRIRLEVANGKIKSENVQILFFDRPGFDVKILEMGLDSDGNILDAPPSYRSFFLNEEMRLMSRGG